MTSDMELSNQSELLATLARQDTAFMALPLFSIEEEDRRRKQPLTYETDVTLNEVPGKFTWQVSADPSYGFPDAFDRKVFKILEALILENERPIKNPLFFSLYRILQVLGLPPLGAQFTRVRTSVQCIASVKIHAQFIQAEGDASSHEAQTFHLFDEVTFQEEIFDDEMGAGNYKLMLGMTYLQSLNSGMIHPIGFEELQSLQSPIAGRLHEILLVKFTDRQVRAQNRWTVSYTELCKLLPVRAVGWMSSPKRQFEEIHNELIGFEIVDRVEWEKTEQGWTVQYIPGIVLQELPLPTAITDETPPDLHEEVGPESVDSISSETDRTPSTDEIGVSEEVVEELEEEESRVETEQTTEQDASRIDQTDSYESEERNEFEYESQSEETDDHAVYDQTELETELTDSEVSPTELSVQLDDGADASDDDYSSEQSDQLSAETIQDNEETEPVDLVEDDTNVTEERESEENLTQPENLVEDLTADSEETGPENMEKVPVSQDAIPGDTDTPDEITASVSENEVISDPSYVSVPLPNMSSFEGGITMSQNGDTLCNIRYLLAWTTRSRDQVLNDDIALRTRSLIREICAIHEAKIRRGVVAADYVQIEVVCPPTLTPSALVNDLKERTLNALQEQFPDLKQQYWGLPLWSGGYMCVTTGDDAETQLNEYLEGKKPADDESFQLIPAP